MINWEFRTRYANMLIKDREEDSHLTWNEIWEIIQND